MFFGYPVAATAENWLHECIGEALRTIHANLDQGKSPGSWPDLIPQQFQSELADKRGLKSGVLNYAKAAKTLSRTERAQVSTCLSEQNEIESLLCDRSRCDRLDDLPDVIRDPVKAIYKSAFELLKPTGVRDRQFQIIHDSFEEPVCPFCGMEYFDDPAAPRPDLDHYLSKSLYPFAAVNLCNLVPMGSTCNQRYKMNIDILVDGMGARRKSFYPYGTGTITVSLDRSVPFEGKDGQIPRWIVDFVPDSEKCKTWDEVFQIRTRISRDLLDHSFKRWLTRYREWCRTQNWADKRIDADVLALLQAYVSYLVRSESVGRDAFQTPVFHMLFTRCRDGDDRLMNLIRLHM